MACINNARSDYEQCLGGVAAGIISDNHDDDDENDKIFITNNLLSKKEKVKECEEKLLTDILDYKVSYHPLKIIHHSVYTMDELSKLFTKNDQYSLFKCPQCFVFITDAADPRLFSQLHGQGRRPIR